MAQILENKCGNQEYFRFLEVAGVFKLSGL